MRKLSDYKPNPDNPRTLRDTKFEVLKKNIKEFEKMLAIRPIVVDKRKVIIGGNSKYQALVSLGYKTVPDEWIVCAADLTEEERRRFIILDNHHAGDDNWEMIANQWDAQELTDWGIDIPAFDPPNTTVNFTASDAKGLRLKVTFQSGEQLNKVVDMLQTMGITDYKIK